MSKLKYNVPLSIGERVRLVTLSKTAKFIRDTDQFYFNPPIVGDRIILFPEPLNKKIPNAIAIYNLALEKMGYLGSEKNVCDYVFDYLNDRSPAFGVVKSIDFSSKTPKYILDLSCISNNL